MNARQSESAAQMLHRTEFAVFPQLGTVWVRWSSDDLLVELALPDLDARAPIDLAFASPMRPALQHAIDDFLNGSPDPFSQLQLFPPKTQFAARVRSAMLAIPRGMTRSYGQLAQAIGSPGASRAVGRACSANPLPLIVPCHRVVAINGPGGFALGPHAKQVLLALDRLSLIASSP